MQREKQIVEFYKPFFSSICVFALSLNIGICQTSSFTPSDTIGCAPLSVDFSNLSTGAMSYLWNFDDGLTSTSISPTHIYYGTGTFFVTLIAYDSIGTTDSFSLTINVPANTPYFSVSNLACPHQMVDFNVFGNFNPANIVLWDFGDGASNSQAFTEHAYVNTGVYPVTLLVESPECGQVVDSSSITITSTLSPLLHIHPENTSNTICPGEAFPYFYDESYAITWDFGDGNISSDPYPYHIYNSTGNYNVTVTVTNECGNSSSVDTTIIVSPNKPASAQAYGPTLICKNDSVNFIDLSGSGSSFQWDMGTGYTDTNRYVTYAFADTGNYTVQLAVTNYCGLMDTDFIQVYVTDTLLPTGWISIPNPNACPNEMVQFIAPSGRSDYAWDFGDGNSSLIQNPTHSYPNPGSYLVTLTLSNNCGSSSFVDTVIINNILSTPALFSTSQITYCVGDIVSLTGNNSSSIKYHYWDFDDGDTDTSQNPEHIYQDTGSFTVTYVITNFCGIADTSWISLVMDSSSYPVSEFSYQLESTCVSSLFSFVNMSSDTNEVNWHFGDGDSSTVVHPMHPYTGAANYLTKLFVTNSCGKKSVSSATITAPAFSQLIAPTTMCMQEGDSLIFSWSPVPGASGYEFSVDNGLSWDTVSSEDTSYSIVGVADSTYTIDIRAISNGTCLIGASSATTSCTYAPVDNILEYSNHDIKIVPNPSSGIFHIVLSKSLDTEHHLTVRNLLGEVVSSGVLTKRGQAIDMTGLPAGIYVVSIQEENNTLTQRVVLTY